MPLLQSSPLFSVSPLEAAHLPCRCRCHCHRLRAEAAPSGQERNKSHSDHHSSCGPVVFGFTFAQGLLRRLGTAASASPSQHTLSKGHSNSTTETWLPIENTSTGVWAPSIRDQTSRNLESKKFIPFLHHLDCTGTVCYATLRKALNAWFQI